MGYLEYIITNLDDTYFKICRVLRENIKLLDSSKCLTSSSEFTNTKGNNMSFL